MILFVHKITQHFLSPITPQKYRPIYSSSFSLLG